MPEDMVNPVTGRKMGDSSRKVATIKGAASKDKLAPLPKTQEELDRDEYSKVIGRPVGIGDQKGFAAWRAKKPQKLTDIAKPK